MSKQEVKVYLPKFRLETDYLLSDTLKNMGMSQAFSPSADFSGISESEGLMIGEVVHKAFVEVDEKGTEAAAATAVIFSLTAAPMPGIVLNVDRPFIFYIRDVPTGTLLFVGRVLDPQ